MVVVHECCCPASRNISMWKGMLDRNTKWKMWAKTSLGVWRMVDAESVELGIAAGWLLDKINAAGVATSLGVLMMVDADSVEEGIILRCL